MDKGNIVKIISTGSLYGNISKYIELLALVKKVKPNILIITGDLFQKTYITHNLSTIKNTIYSDFLNKYSEYCDKVFYIFGEEDAKAFENNFKEKAHKAICLNYINYNYNNYTFIGLPFVKDTEQPLKDWVRPDSRIVNFNDTISFHTNEDLSITKISDNYAYLINQKSIPDILEEKLKNTLPNKILISHYPPNINELYDSENFNETLNEMINIFDFVFCGHSKANNTEKLNHRISIKNTNILNHNHLNSMLLYNFLIIENNTIKYNFYPLNQNNNETITNAIEYRKIN